jgi:hypothetical protein
MRAIARLDAIDKLCNRYPGTELSSAVSKRWHTVGLRDLRMRYVLAFLLSALGSTTCASTDKVVVTSRGATASQDLSYENIEFPPYDQSIWRRHRSGRVAKAATAAAQTPSAPEAPALLAETGRLDDALRSLEALVDRYPGRIAAAFDLLTPEFRRFNDQVHLERRDRLQQIVIAARRQAEQLPREDAARALYHVMFAEAMFFPGGARYEAERQRQRETFLEEYRATEAARILEVDMISRPSEIDNLRKFAADNPGTVAAAKALHQAGFQLAVNVGISGRVPKGTDPTDRILQVVQIVNELQSGRYPRCEWTETAPSLVIQVFASQPDYAPHNIDKLLLVYQTLLDQHPDFVSLEDVTFAVGTLTRMAQLYRLKGNEDGIDTVFDNLDRRPGHAGAGGYLKAMLYIGPMNDQRREEKPQLLKKF